MSEKSSHNIWAWLLPIVIICIVVPMRFMEKSKISKEVKPQAYAHYASQLENEPLARQLVDQYHEACFEKCYNLRIRRGPSTFYEGDYYELMDERISSSLKSSAATRSNANARRSVHGVLPEKRNRALSRSTRRGSDPRPPGPPGPPGPPLASEVGQPPMDLWDRAIWMCYNGTDAQKISAISTFKNDKDIAHQSQIAAAVLSLVVRESDPVKLAALKLVDARPAIWSESINATVMSLIADKNDQVQSEAFKVMLQRDPGALAKIVNGVYRLCEPAAKVRILQRVAQDRPGQAIQWHVAALNDDATIVREAAHSGLIGMGSNAELAVIYAVQNNKLYGKGAKVDAVQVLAHTKGPAARDALKIWTTHYNPELRQASRRALRSIAPNEFDKVDEAILDLDDNAQREGALVVLAAAKADDRMPLVSEKLYKLAGQVGVSGPSTPGRSGRADPLMEALTTWADAPTVKRLIKDLKTIYLSGRQKLAVGVLSARKEPKAVRPMLELIVKQWDMVQEPLVSMGPMIEPDLLVLFRHENKSVQLKACVLSASVGTTASMRMLIRLRRDKNKDVRAMAKWASEIIRQRMGGQPTGRLRPPVSVDGQGGSRGSRGSQSPIGTRGSSRGR